MQISEHCPSDPPTRMGSCFLHMARQILCAGNMINKATYKLAKELAPRWKRASDYSKSVFLNWAERILMYEDEVPCFLMKVLQHSKQGLTIYHSETDELEILTKIRSLYESECLRGMSKVSREAKH